MFRLILATGFSCIFSISAMAAVPPQSDASSVKIEKSSLEGANHTKGDLDKEVSDIKLRAASGGKNKLSASFSLSYAGGSLADPGSHLRPHVGSAAYTEPVSMSGNFGFRYRFNKNQSMFGGAGFYQSTPFHNDAGTDPDVEVDTPQIAINDTFAADRTQIGQTLRAYWVTRDYQREYGERWMASYSVSALNPIGESRFDGGIRMDAWYTGHDKDSMQMKMGPVTQTVDLRTAQVDYGFAFVPSIQWNKRGRWNVYTSANLLRYQHKRADSGLNFDRARVTQQLGAGVAVLRDFYLSPYVQFEPGRMTSDQTSVNLSATINL